MDRGGFRGRCVTGALRRYYSIMDLESTLSSLAPNLIRFCTGITRDPSEGEELAQESLVALVRFWRLHGPPESPAAFAYTVARRQALRFHRRLRRWLPLELVEERRHPGDSPEDSAIRRQQVEEALEALGAFSLKDRQALLLAADGELGVAGAARVMGVTPAAFKMRVSRARQRLARYLETEHERRKPERGEACTGP